jgi:membrane protease YdiL (CAAX protease family)
MDAKARESEWEGMHGLLLFVLVMAAPFVPDLRLWPWPWAAPLASYYLLVALTPSLRASFHRPRFGKITSFGIGAAVLIAVVSCVVLVGFRKVMHPDMRPYMHAIPVQALGGVVTAGICFSGLNALMEELVFRSVFFKSIDSQWGSWPAVCGTAALFGYGHLHGYPPGAVGAILAGIYGFALGWLRMFSGGIGLPLAAHIAADATIYSILAQSRAL